MTGFTVVSVAEQVGLRLIWPETLKTVFMCQSSYNYKTFLPFIYEPKDEDFMMNKPNYTCMTVFAIDARRYSKTRS